MDANLNFNTAINTAVNNALAGALVEGVAYSLAAGIVGSFFRPMNAGPFGFAQMPSMFNIAAGFNTPALNAAAFAGAGQLAALSQPQAQFTATMGQGGTANIKLGDGYELNLNENNSEINIVDHNNGQTTKIWGDPHVDVNGKHAFDFAGTTTFELKNGTKITVNTEQWKGNPNAYVASNVVITKGNQALVVNGISQNQLGDLSITQSNGGYAADAIARDGYVLHESDAGWVSEHTGQVATQADMDATIGNGAYAPGQHTISLGEYGGMMGNWLLSGMMNTPTFSAASDTKIEQAVAKATAQVMHRMFAAV